MRVISMFPDLLSQVHKRERKVNFWPEGAGPVESKRKKRISTEAAREVERPRQRVGTPSSTALKGSKMSREQDNKAIVGRWFDGFWGNPWNPKIIDELAAPDMLLQYSLHAPRRGRDD